MRSKRRSPAPVRDLTPAVTHKCARIRIAASSGESTPVSTVRPEGSFGYSKAPATRSSSKSAFERSFPNSARESSSIRRSSSEGGQVSSTNSTRPPASSTAAAASPTKDSRHGPLWGEREDQGDASEGGLAEYGEPHLLAEPDERLGAELEDRGDGVDYEMVVEEPIARQARKLPAYGELSRGGRSVQEDEVHTRSPRTFSMRRSGMSHRTAIRI